MCHAIRILPSTWDLTSSTWHKFVWYSAVTYLWNKFCSLCENIGKVWIIVKLFACSKICFLYFLLLFFYLKRTIWTWTRIWISDFQISSLVLLELSWFNWWYRSKSLSLESNTMQAIVIYNTICHHLTSKLTSSLFILMI